MSTSHASYLNLARDMALAAITLIFGRLLPTLKPPPIDLTGKVAIVTGGNSGIGLSIALDLARQGSTVYLACRNASKAEDAVSQITSQVPKSLVLDTSSLDSVRACATHWATLGTNIDLLFHNAGIGAAPVEQQLSPDGFPMVYATNFLGSFLLTHLLERHLSPGARVIMTSSVGHYASAFAPNFSLNKITAQIESGFHAAGIRAKVQKAAPSNTAYYQTKAMQVVFAHLLQNHFDRQAANAETKAHRTAHAFNPGFVATPFFDNLSSQPGFFANPVFWFLDATIAILGVDASQGAATAVWLACTDDEAAVGQGMGGGYWDRMGRRVSSVDLMGKELVERFWVRWEADAGVEWR